MKEPPVFRLVTHDHCRVLAPWCLVRAGTAPVFAVRRIAHALDEAGRRTGGTLERALAGVLYLATSMRQVSIAWREQARGVRQHYGIGLLEQFRSLLRVAWLGNLPPRVYYFQRLFRHREPQVQLAGIEHWELQLLLRAVHAGVDCTELDDKLAFHAFCARHDLPTPPVVAVYARGERLQSTEPPTAWQADLFCKPARSYSSRGIASWRHLPGIQSYTDGTLTLDRPGLDAWFAAQSRDHTVIVQPRVFNSPEIAALSGSALANCRIVTAQRADGTFFVLLAGFRMGTGDAITSDNPDVSFCAGVDLKSGRLHAGESKRASLGSFARHPDTGAPIAGVVLPHWSEMCELALRAHRALAQMAFVGWDLILTPDGPALLEGNVIWGGNLAQMAGNVPLGTTEFPAIFLHHYYRRAKAADASPDLAATAAPFAEPFFR